MGSLRMGTLAQIAPVLGLLAGYIVAKLTPYEFKQGEKYFKALSYALLAVTIGIAAWQNFNKQPIQLSVPIFLLFIPVGTLYHKRYFLLGSVAAVYAVITLLTF